MLCKGNTGGVFSTGGRGGGGQICKQFWLVQSPHDGKCVAFKGRNQCVQFLNLEGFTTACVQLMEERFGFFFFFQSKFFIHKTVNKSWINEKYRGTGGTSFTSSLVSLTCCHFINAALIMVFGVLKQSMGNEIRY